MGPHARAKRQKGGVKVVVLGRGRAAHTLARTSRFSARLASSKLVPGAAAVTACAPPLAARVSRVTKEEWPSGSLFTSSSGWYTVSG